jgi:hypothetical protein
VAPAALTVATATEISAAVNGSKGWLDWGLVIEMIPVQHYSKYNIREHCKTSENKQNRHSRTCKQMEGGKHKEELLISINFSDLVR